MVMFTSGQDAINLKITNKYKIFMAITFGITCLIVPVLMILMDPLHAIVNYSLRLKTGSALVNLVLQELKGAHISLYIFNITNPDRFLSGEDPKLKVKEVGPFVYQSQECPFHKARHSRANVTGPEAGQLADVLIGKSSARVFLCFDNTTFNPVLPTREYRWFEDMEMNEDGTEMAMTPKIRSEFVLEESIGDPKDINLTLGNLPMLSATTILSNYPSWIRSIYSTLAAQVGAKSIMNLDVHSYLWGYDNPLITLCNKLVPGLVYFDTIGLLDRLYDQEAVYRIVTGATSKDRFKIKTVTKTRYLDKGGINDVEVSVLRFNDTYEGLGYPPELTPDIPINLYRVPLCKTLNLEYIGKRNMYYGGEGLVYTLSNSTFHSDINPVSNKKFPEGVLDISKCYYGLPFVISKSHFLDADPKLLDQVEGLKPDRQKFVNELVVDQRVGITFETRMSIQLSLMLDDISYNREARRFANSVLPILRVELEQPQMPSGIMMAFYLVYKVGPWVLIIIEILLSILGLALLWKGVRSMYFNWLSGTKMIILETSREKRILTETLSSVPLIRYDVEKIFV